MPAVGQELWPAMENLFAVRVQRGRRLSFLDRRPSPGTCISGPFADGANMIVSDWFHVPPSPDPSPVSQMTCANAPETAIFFSFWSAKNPTNCPSGDQNG